MRIFREKVLLILSALSVGLFLFGLGLVYFNIDKFSSPVILHFDAFRGIDFFGSVSDVWAILIFGATAMIINTILAETIFYRERTLSYIFVSANLFISILLLVFSATVVSVNL